MVAFAFPTLSRRISEEEAAWLVGQLRSGRELSEAAAVLASRIEHASGQEEVLETSLEEKRALVAALDRGSRKARSRELRLLEIDLHTALYSETYLRER